MAGLDEIKGWFERDLRFATWEDNAWVDASDPNKISVCFYTDTNEYLLTIVAGGDDTTVIDAVVKPRKSRAGQTVARVRRLLPPGGMRLNERTWRRIVGSIVGLELVRVHRREAAGSADEADEPRLTERTRVKTG